MKERVHLVLVCQLQNNVHFLYIHKRLLHTASVSLPVAVDFLSAPLTGSLLLPPPAKREGTAVEEDEYKRQYLWKKELRRILMSYSLQNNVLIYHILLLVFGCVVLPSLLRSKKMR